MAEALRTDKEGNLSKLEFYKVIPAIALARFLGGLLLQEHLFNIGFGIDNSCHQLLDQFFWLRHIANLRKLCELANVATAPYIQTVVKQGNKA